MHSSHSLANNAVCGITRDIWGSPQGTYTTEGIIAIAEALRVNTTLVSIK